MYFKETTYIDKEDFTKVFEHAINKARHEAIKDEARDDFTRMTRRNTHNENNYDLGEVRRVWAIACRAGLLIICVRQSQIARVAVLLIITL